MPGSVTFHLKGAKELEDFLKEFGPKVARNLGMKALRAGARPIVTEARRLAPRATGRLMRSITAVAAKREKPNERMVHIGVKSPGRRYAHLLEFGTSKMSAKPFLRPAIDTKADEALKKMGEALAVGIARQEWRGSLGNIAAGDDLFAGDIDG